MGRPLITRVPAPAIQKPGAADLDYTPETPSLAAFTQTELGDAGTPADGFDAALGLVAADLPGDIAGLDGMDVSLSDLASADADVSGFEVDTDIANFGTAVASGDALLAAFDDSLAGNSPPPDTNTDGGGGAGSGITPPPSTSTTPPVPTGIDDGDYKPPGFHPLQP